MVLEMFPLNMCMCKDRIKQWFTLPTALEEFLTKLEEQQEALEFLIPLLELEMELL